MFANLPNSTPSLCFHFRFVLEHELLTLLTPVLFPSTQSYTPPATLRHRLSSSSWLVHEMAALPAFFWRAFEILAELIGEYAGDWRVARAVTGLIRAVIETMSEEGWKQWLDKVSRPIP